ncbi:cobalamin-dependent protein [Alloiococcus sp. CFN-8]|uniref:cobalamin-dependent protein n=1 Tax=Alloiococcus sp. CFN-8 TaxID=3416081 RepID=UPI003CFAFC9F
MDTLSLRLKKLRLDKGYTQKKLADQLGVKQTAIANYEKALRVPDIDMLVKIADMFQVSLDFLYGRENPESFEDYYRKDIDTETANKEELHKIYLEHLLKGDKLSARELVLQLQEEGMDISTIYLEVLEKALVETGTRWEKGTLEVWEEHFISETTLDLMREVKLKENKARIFKGSVLTLTPGAELHSIGVKMISDVLELKGYRVYYLGCNIPMNSLLKAIEDKKPKYLALSVTMAYHMDSAKYLIDGVKRALKNKRPIIIIGGAAFREGGNPCRETGADFYGGSLLDILTFVK